MQTVYPDEIKWIFAQRVDDGEWKVRGLTTRENSGTIEDSRMFDETQISEMKRSEFAIFKNRENWLDFRPRRYLDLRDKSERPICGLGNLINSFESDWF
jgi:hypothetical protein